jgi:hypothetical protein
MQTSFLILIVIVLIGFKPNKPPLPRESLRVVDYPPATARIPSCGVLDLINF